MGILSRKWRTKLRISARLPGWLENSSFLFFISDRITLARVSMASSFDHRKIRAAERAPFVRQSLPPDRPGVVQFLLCSVCEAKTSRPRWTQFKSEVQFRAC